MTSSEQQYQSSIGESSTYYMANRLANADDYASRWCPIVGSRHGSRGGEVVSKDFAGEIKWGD